MVVVRVVFCVVVIVAVMVAVWEFFQCRLGEFDDVDEIGRSDVFRGLLHFPSLGVQTRSLLKPLTKAINLVKYGFKIEL